MRNRKRYWRHCRGNGNRRSWIDVRVGQCNKEEKQCDKEKEEYNRRRKSSQFVRQYDFRGEGQRESERGLVIVWESVGLRNNLRFINAHN